MKDRHYKKSFNPSLYNLIILGSIDRIEIIFGLSNKLFHWEYFDKGNIKENLIDLK